MGIIWCMRKLQVIQLWTLQNLDCFPTGLHFYIQLNIRLLTATWGVWREYQPCIIWTSLAKSKMLNETAKETNNSWQHAQNTPQKSKKNMYMHAWLQTLLHWGWGIFILTFLTAKWIICIVMFCKGPHSRRLCNKTESEQGYWPDTSLKGKRKLMCKTRRKAG